MDGFLLELYTDRSIRRFKVKENNETIELTKFNGLCVNFIFYKLSDDQNEFHVTHWMRKWAWTGTQFVRSMCWTTNYHLLYCSISINIFTYAFWFLFIRITQGKKWNGLSMVEWTMYTRYSVQLIRWTREMINELASIFFSFRCLDKESRLTIWTRGSGLLFQSNFKFRFSELLLTWL